VSGAPRFFATPEELRAWFDEHAASGSELVVGFWKSGTGRPSVTWPQSVDEALCVGWIDGVRRRVDDESYTIRFTPRRRRSIWSAVNLARFAALTEEDRVRPAGVAAFEARGAERVYSHERTEDARLDPAEETAFQASTGAWDYFLAQAPSYRRAALHWVVSAKRAETRARRLQRLVADSTAGRRLSHLTRPIRRDRPTSDVGNTSVVPAAEPPGPS
jgi:uncharacterized protein YdeI (YjbR/CyaY-like superfamily)